LAYVVSGGGWFHTADPDMPNVAMPQGSIAFLPAGYLYAWKQGKAPTTLLSCLSSNADYKSPDMDSLVYPDKSLDVLPNEEPMSPEKPMFFNAATKKHAPIKDSEAFGAKFSPLGMTSYPIVPVSAHGGMSLYSVAMSVETSTHHFADNSALVFNVGDATVAASTDTALTDIPPGSMYAVNSGTKFKFVTEQPGLHHLLYVNMPALLPEVGPDDDKSCSTLQKIIRFSKRKTKTCGANLKKIKKFVIGEKKEKCKVLRRRQRLI